jgi:hypothetical protein
MLNVHECRQSFEKISYRAKPSENVKQSRFCDVGKLTLPSSLQVITKAAFIRWSWQKELKHSWNREQQEELTITLKFSYNI